MGRSFSIDDINSFLRKELGAWIGKRSLGEDTDLFGELGVDGDDCGEFLQAFAQRFDVDMAGFLWFFHHGEEGYSPFSWIFPPPDRRVGRIPVTPGLLLASANAGKWAVDYPAYSLPKRRYDMIASWALLGLILCLVAIGLIYKLLQ